VVNLFTSEVSLVLIATVHGGMARLSGPSFTYRDDLSVCSGESPMQEIQTVPGSQL